MKKFLLSLLIAWLSFIGFSNAWSFTFTGSVSNSFSNYADVVALPIPLVNHNSCDSIDLSCTFTSVSNGWYVRPKLYYSYSSYSITNKYITADLWNNFLLDNWTVNMTLSSSPCNRFIYFSFSNVWWSVFTFKYSCTFSWDNVSDGGSCPTCPECEVCTPQYTSSECQSEYNLIPISDIDSEYCTTNDLCEFTWSYSNIYINDIWFPSKPFIYLSIPDTINWDYTWNSWSMSVDVWDYNVDTDYIDWLVAMNTYQPTSEDFTNVFVGGLTLIFPYIFIALLILFIRKLVKRIFK